MIDFKIFIFVYFLKRLFVLCYNIFGEMIYMKNKKDEKIDGTYLKEKTDSLCENYLNDNQFVIIKIFIEEKKIQLLIDQMYQVSNIKDIDKKQDVIYRNILLLKKELNSFIKLISTGPFNEVFDNYMELMVDKYKQLLNDTVVFNGESTNYKDRKYGKEKIDITFKMLDEVYKINNDLQIYSLSKLETLNVRDKQILKVDKNLDDVSLILRDIDILRYEQEKNIQRLVTNIENSTSIVKRVQNVVDTSNQVLDSFLLNILIANMIPKKSVRYSFLTLETLKFMGRVMSPRIKEEEVDLIQVTDYSYDIYSILNDVEKISYMLDNISREVVLIKDKFITDFFQYKGLLVEYDSVIEKLDLILFTIDKEKEEINNNKEELKKQENINYEKVKTRTILE